MQFERLTSLERILENGNLEGKNTHKKKYTKMERGCLRMEEISTDQENINCEVYILLNGFK